MAEYEPNYENNGIRTIVEVDYQNATSKISLLEVLQAVHDLQLPEEWKLIKVELYEILFNSTLIKNTKVAYHHYTFQSILAYKVKNRGSEK